MTRTNRKYSLVKEIGSGTFGRVWMAKDLISGELVAIKRRPKWQSAISREVEAMESIKNEEGVVSMTHCFYSMTKGGIIMQNIVMPLMNKSLGTFIRDQRSIRKRYPTHRLPPKLVKSIAYQIAKGLHKLHITGYTHRDFKPDNILLSYSSEENDPTKGGFDVIVKICDLGSSKKLVSNNIHMPYVVSRFYRAPELLFGSCIYNEKIDIWENILFDCISVAIGCIFAELLSLDPIFVGRCPEKSQMRANSGRQGLDEPYQIMKIIEILGTPTIEDFESINRMIPKVIRSQHSDLSFLREIEVSPLSWSNILDGFYCEE
ncbi:protein kinase domain-containing protein [Cryptosporidium serpentis]